MAEVDRVVSLVRTIVADTALREQLTEASESDRAAILAERGFGDVSRADVENNAHLFRSQGVEEIEDDQLASVAGGGDTGIPDTTVSPAACSIAVAT